MPNIRWGQCMSNWFRKEDGAGCGKVMVIEVTDANGSSPISSQLLEVLLPYYSNGDPNLQLGNVIGFELEESDNTLVCSTDYMDAKIGSVRQWVGSVDPTFGLQKQGWALMGDNDSRATFSMENKMARGAGPEVLCGNQVQDATVVGDADGSDCLTLPEEGVDPGTGQPVDNPWSLAHHHSIDEFTLALSATEEGLDCFIGATGCPTILHSFFTGDCLDGDMGGNFVCDSGPWNVDNRPEFRSLYFIERYDNSQNALDAA